MLREEELTKLKETITKTSRPIVFFDDDADGLVSYLLVKQANTEAIGYRAARGPELTHHFIGFVNKHSPDAVLILDKPLLSEEFVQAVKTPTLWLDHHDKEAYKNLQQYQHLTYINPSVNEEKDHRPTSYWVYEATKGPLWLAAAGAISDWDETLIQELRAQHPELLQEAQTIPEILYTTPLGEIIRVLNFCLKGSTQEIATCVEALTKIQTPQELLENTSKASKHIHKHVQPILQEYKKQLSQASKETINKGVYTYVFDNLNTSLVTNVANELHTTTQAKILIIGRKDKTNITFSMRSENTHLPEILSKALTHVRGYGGGHSNACGGSIHEDDWKTFITYIQENH
ncbi:MAG: DHH family phosphoesterase [Candidatus Woesearchaeota archaeon]